MRFLTIISALFLFAWPGVCGPLKAQEAPYAGIQFEELLVEIDGKDYRFGYRRYPEPHALDLSERTAGRSTPFGTARGFWHALATGPGYDSVAVYTRTADGQPAPRPADEMAHMAAARDILDGGVQLYSEIAYGEYRIFVYRYPKSIPRNLGLPVRRFGDRHFVIADLVEVDPLAQRMSAFRWDIDRLVAEHPAR